MANSSQDTPAHNTPPHSTTAHNTTAHNTTAHSTLPHSALKPDVRVGPNEVLRFALELFTLFSLGVWGYLAWPFPWPGVAFMVGAPLFAIVVWALFRSPKALIPVDIVGRGIVEIAIMGSAAIAWAMLGHPIIAGVFAMVALVSGIINLRKEARRENAT